MVRSAAVGYGTSKVMVGVYEVGGGKAEGVVGQGAKQEDDIQLIRTETMFSTITKDMLE